MDENPSKLRSKPKDEPKTELNAMLRLTLSLVMKPGLKSRGSSYPSRYEKYIGDHNPILILS